MQISERRPELSSDGDLKGFPESFDASMYRRNGDEGLQTHFSKVILGKCKDRS